MQVLKQWFKYWCTDLELYQIYMYVHQAQCQNVYTFFSFILKEDIYALALGWTLWNYWHLTFDPQNRNFIDVNLKYKIYFLKDIQETVNAIILWKRRESNLGSKHNCKILNNLMYYFLAKNLIKYFKF